MRELKVRSIVEGGLITGLSIIFTWLTYWFFPFFFVCPLPLMFLSYRHGVKLSFISLMISLLFSFLLINPVYSIFVFLPSCFLGVFLGYGLKKNLSFTKLFFIGTLIFFGMELFSILFSVLALNIPLEKAIGIDVLKESWGQSLNMLEGLAKRTGGLQNLEDLKKMQNQMLDSLSMLIPSLLLFSSFLQVLVSYFIAEKILKRFDFPIKPIPNIETLRISKKLFMRLLIVYVIALILNNFFPIQVFKYAVTNIFFMIQILIFLEGCFVLWNFMKLFLPSRILRGILFVLLIFNPLLESIIFVVGLIDIFYPLREKFLNKKELEL
ncbi:MAG TPA: DUF2232 domain-containing protein [Dictyoglomaceae bacterium]|nr:DUF2232 domain-containing protein [Dictyoglomaceae bacterium]HOL38959.1 DUF2232 domain-containing protein [Dictyoglomaceae bacterium]HOP94853.1 DUF2232 domain-containing protein [Dictyoglomaceae bacterium]HPP15624.1 DUF2232 domain-containing protein [Dictyoglomaceae bacterium]HPU43509.1 DUF2232 domain-containing protein [Dictyoglomaceae bacterium]